MSYQISLRDISKVYFTPINIKFISLSMGLPLMISIILILHLGLQSIIPIILLWYLILHVTFSHIGDGWKLEQDRLELKLGSISHTIALKDTETKLVDTVGDWSPLVRTKGFGSPGLSAGEYKLKNNKIAIVFRHLDHGKTLILLANNQRYLICHPGVEDLYRQIVQLNEKRKVE